MDVLLPETKPLVAPGIEEVQAICTLLEDHKGGDVVALDLRELHSWTDFFIIATVTSSAHLQGLARRIRDFAAREHLSVFGGRKDINSSWNLVDMGTAVIHLMNAQSRDFYELEELWLSARRIYPAEPKIRRGIVIPHSSKSS